MRLVTQISAQSGYGITNRQRIIRGKRSRFGQLLPAISRSVRCGCLHPSGRQRNDNRTLVLTATLLEPTTPKKRQRLRNPEACLHPTDVSRFNQVNRCTRCNEYQHLVRSPVAKNRCSLAFSPAEGFTLLLAFEYLIIQKWRLPRLGL